MPAEYVKDDFFRPIWQLGTPEKFGSIGLRGKNNQTYFGDSALELAIWTEEIARTCLGFLCPYRTVLRF